jgi:flagellar biosynthesis chaperone FliJ
MNENFKNASVRVSVKLYERISEYANSKGISISDVFRNGAENFIDAIETDRTNVETDPAGIEQVIATLREELGEKNKQIEHLHQLLAMQSKTASVLTEQMDAMKQLEDLRQSRPWWRRLFGGEQTA